MRCFKVFLILVMLLGAAACGKGIETGMPEPIDEVELQLTTSNAQYVVSINGGVAGVQRFEGGKLTGEDEASVETDEDGKSEVKFLLEDGTRVKVTWKEENGEVKDALLYINDEQVDAEVDVSAPPPSPPSPPFISEDSLDGGNSSVNALFGPKGAIFTAVDAGKTHTCAIDKEKALWCWGSNDEGQLGTDEFSGQSSVPVKVEALGVEVKSVTLGAVHTCVIDESDDVWCWGGGAYNPEKIGGLSGVSEIAANGFETCALVNKEVKCWSGISKPVVVEGLSNVVSISAGFSSFCAAVDNLEEGEAGKEVRCWKNSMQPFVIPTPDDFVDFVSGSNHNCAIDAEGKLWCMGDNSHGQIGNGLVGEGGGLTPKEVESIGVVAFVSAGAVHTCAINMEKKLYCWGDNSDGQLGDDEVIGTKPAPNKVRTPKKVNQVSAGIKHTCAISAEGDVWCWGDNEYGQLGHQNSKSSKLPQKVEF